MTETAPDPRRWKALGVLGLIQFMLILDVTVVNVALPNIQTDLDFTEAGLAWVVNGYVLMAGGLLLLGGRLADMLGRKQVFLIGVAVFGLASAACGAAFNAEMLVTARFVQGIGEALAAPASLGLIAVMFPDPQERIKALGLWGGIAGLGGTSGTVISGFLTDLADWRWIFLINLPVAAFALLVVPALVAESRMERESHRPDVAGALTGTAGLIGIVYGLLEAAEHDWVSGNVLVPLIGGVALLVVMVVVEWRSTDPLIPLSFFRNRTRVVTNVVTLFFSAGFFSYFFLLTLFEQQVLDYSPIESGLSYLPFGLTIGAGIGFGTAMMPRLGVKRILGAGFVLCAVGLALTSRLDVGSGYAADILPGMVILAFGSGISFPAFGNASLHEVTGQDSSLASGVQQAVQQIGGALGLATIVTIALRHADDQIADVARQGVVITDAVAGNALSEGFALGWQVAVGLLLVGAVLVIVFLEHVLAVPRNVLVEEAAAEVDETPEPV